MDEQESKKIESSRWQGYYGYHDGMHRALGQAYWKSLKRIQYLEEVIMDLEKQLGDDIWTKPWRQSYTDITSAEFRDRGFR